MSNSIAPIDFTAFRADLAAALKAVEDKYGFSMGIGRITYDGVTGAFRSQFDATPVDLVEGIDVLKLTKLAEISSLRAYCGQAAFKARAACTQLGGDIVAVGFVPQRKNQVTAIVVTGPKKGHCFHVPKTFFKFGVVI